MKCKYVKLQNEHGDRFHMKVLFDQHFVEFPGSLLVVPVNPGRTMCEWANYNLEGAVHKLNLFLGE